MNSQIYSVEENEYLEYEPLTSHDVIGINIPDTCSLCKLTNFYVWGTRINGELEVEVKCIKCGEVVYKMHRET